MTQNRILTRTAVAFFIALSMCTAFVYLVERNRQTQLRQAIAEVSAAQAYSLERQLNRSLSATYALAFILRQNKGIHDFDALAADMIANYGGISSLQLAPDGVVTQIYPLEGNEAAIGHDLLNDPNRRTEALETISSKELTLAGPFELVQGGVAVIGRYPVFLPDEETGEERFWGFTIVLIGLPELLEATNLNQLSGHGFEYELSRQDPDTGERVIFDQSSDGVLRNSISYDIEVPNGRWALSIAPQNGWISPFFLSMELFLILFVSAMVAFIANQNIRHTEEISKSNELLTTEIDERKRAEAALKISNDELEHRVEERTAELSILIAQLEEQISERKEAENEIQKLNLALEQRVDERTKELQRVINLMAGREVRMAELKEAIRQLRAQLGEAGLDPVAGDPLGVEDLD